MKRDTLYTIESPYRDDFRIEGFTFGEGKKSVAIVGAMRGDEIQQQYICARIVAELKKIEQKGLIEKGHQILVIPSCNPFSMNVNHRFWTMDKTDINRMFPGYDKGETTQRIADAVFCNIKDFEYGIQMASFYMPGDFVPHVRMLKTGYEAIEDAKLFALPYVAVRNPKPFDTALLNYNWQIWGTKAFSIYAGQTQFVESKKGTTIIESILRFMSAKGVIKQHPIRQGYISNVIDEGALVNVKSDAAGLFNKYFEAGEIVSKGDVLAQVINPYDGSVLRDIIAPESGEIFFSHNKHLIFENSVSFRIYTGEKSEDGE